MSNNNFLPKIITINPVIYAYEDSHPDFKGLLKIGYTKNDANKRIKEQYPIVRPVKTWKLLLEESAMKSDGSIISDHDVRNLLIKKSFKKIKGEWIKCELEDVKSAIISLSPPATIPPNIAAASNNLEVFARIISKYELTVSCKFFTFES